MPILGAGSSFPGSQGPRPSVAAPTKTGQRRGRLHLPRASSSKCPGTKGLGLPLGPLVLGHTLRVRQPCGSCQPRPVRTPCLVLLMQPVSCVSNCSRPVYYFPTMTVAGRLLKSYSRHCVLACINVFPHLPIVLPNLREHRRRAGRYFAGGHTACGAEAAAGAFWLRGLAL